MKRHHPGAHCWRGLERKHFEVFLSLNGSTHIIVVNPLLEDSNDAKQKNVIRTWAHVFERAYIAFVDSTGYTQQIISRELLSINCSCTTPHRAQTVNYYHSSNVLMNSGILSTFRRTFSPSQPQARNTERRSKNNFRTHTLRQRKRHGNDRPRNLKFFVCKHQHMRKAFEMAIEMASASRPWTRVKAEEST